MNKKILAKLKRSIAVRKTKLGVKEDVRENDTIIRYVIYTWSFNAWAKHRYKKRKHLKSFEDCSFCRRLAEQEREFLNILQPIVGGV